MVLKKWQSFKNEFEKFSKKLEKLSKMKTSYQIPAGQVS